MLAGGLHHLNGNGTNAANCELDPPTFEDELRAVSVATPLPDILPRSYDEIKRMRKMRRDAESGRKFVAPRCELPPPYVNDFECDEFEDATISTAVENLSQVAPPEAFVLQGPTVEGKVSKIFNNGMLYKVVADDGCWYFYNDTEKYEMHVRFRFGAKSELQPGERVDIFVRSNKEIEAFLVVYPGETQKLISGEVNGFKCMAKAAPLPEDKRAGVFAASAERIRSELREIAKNLGLSSENELEEGNVFDYCVERGVAYIDCSFPPCDQSIFRPGVDSFKLRSLPWRRPEEYIPRDQLDEVRLFRHKILPSHVTQGDIGNSYFASAVACLAEVPDKVRDLFRHPVSATHGKSERSVGAYWVTLNYNGWWCPVVVDDYLPAYREGPEYLRCAVDLRRLWVPLLEKAYAKVYRSYSNIVSGDPLEPLQDFTGFPITRFDQDWDEAVKGDDELFKRILIYNKKGFITMLYTPPSEPVRAAQESGDAVSSQTLQQDKLKELGLKHHSGYCVIRSRYFDEFDLSLVQIRNPWGGGEEWAGKWSKNDKRWEKYPAVRAGCFSEAGDDKESDNAFWMEWSDALKIFTGGGVCHVKSNWFDYRVRGEFSDGYPTVCLEINVADPVDAYIVLSQEDERGGAAMEYAALLLSVSRHGSKNESVVCTSDVDVEKPGRLLKFNFARDVALRYTFEPEGSPYFVIPRIHDQSISKPYVLGLLLDTYAGNGIKVEFTSIDRSCKVFHNMPSFSVKNMTKDVVTGYQIRNPRQPVECIGAEIVDERLAEFGLVE
ncbi:putative calpain-like cysteine peptidase [Trypanosoma vivax]|nr:putative calpain-like cysteine peptidase [Trypanosoma vivax]